MPAARVARSTRQSALWCQLTAPPRRWAAAEPNRSLGAGQSRQERVNAKLELVGPKTDRSRRSIALPEVAVAALRAHRTRQRMERLVAGSCWQNTGHVFATSVGTPIEAARVTRSFALALDRAGLPHTRFHDLRHAAATFLLAQGFTLEDVKNLLGHSSIVLTSNTYGRVLVRRQEQVARGMDAVLAAPI